MFVRPATQRPTVLAVRFLNRQVIDACDAATHKAAVVELPVLVAISTEPIAGIVTPLIGKAYRDACAIKGPEFFDQV